MVWHFEEQEEEHVEQAQETEEAALTTDLDGLLGEILKFLRDYAIELIFMVCLML